MASKFKTIVAPISLVLEKGGEAVEPGTPIKLPAEEADSIIKRFGAVEHVPETAKEVVTAGKGGSQPKEGEGSGDGNPPQA